MLASALWGWCSLKELAISKPVLSSIKQKLKKKRKHVEVFRFKILHLFLFLI